MCLRGIDNNTTEENTREKSLLSQKKYRYVSKIYEERLCVYW